jgi:hypothetical protein
VTFAPDEGAAGISGGAKQARVKATDDNIFAGASGLSGSDRLTWEEMAKPA